MLTAHTGEGAGPLIIVGVVVSYVVTLLLSRRPKSYSMAEPAPLLPRLRRVQRPSPNPSPSESRSATG